MEVAYKRSLYKSYMHVEDEEEFLESYELMMLKNCRIPQLLSLQTVVADGNIKYVYEISGKQQLADYFSVGKVNKSNLEDMLFSIDRICRTLKDYLLDENRLCLQLDFMYIDLTDKQIYFTYLPFWEKELPHAFIQWTEEVLKRIDHEDLEGTKLAYGVHELALRDNISMNVIFSEIRQNREKEEEEKAENLEQNRQGVFVKQEKPERREAEEGEEKQRQISKIKKFIFNYFKLEWVEKIQKVYLEKIEKCRFQKKKEWRKKVPKQPEIEVNRFTEYEKKEKSEESACQYPTEYLELSSAKPLGRLLYQGRNKCSDFTIEQDEFLLGKKEGCVNGVIIGEGISRLHAKINRQEHHYYIEDLNSTNGTFLNEQLLEYHQPESLNKNDKIRFGGEEYVFC